MFDCNRDHFPRARPNAFQAFAVVAAVMLASILAGAALALPTSFTYQGQLKRSGTPYTGNADLTFRMFNQATGGSLVATLNKTGVPVAGGLFTTQLDFGAIFDGSARWMEIVATTPGNGPTTLAPRQEITSVPHASRASFAEAGGSGGSPWASNGTDLWYPNGGVGVIGGSSPFPSGKGVFLEGGFPDGSHIFSYDYDTPTALNLLLNWPGGNVGIGTLSPEARLHVVAGNKYGIKAHATGGGAGPVSSGIWGIGDGSTFTGPAVGVLGESDWGDGVRGIASSSAWFGGYFDNTAGGTALFCDGLADVRSLRILGGADIVEGFEARDEANAGTKPQPGDVLVIDDARAGELRTSSTSYDRKVAGVVSGANGISHGMKLGQDGALDGETLVAMTGRVYVKCSAENGAVRPGDLLTTSETSGHAMRVTDQTLANGAVIGKAMSSLEEGAGLVLVLVNLQ